jgi:hypothetical protein
MRNPAPTKPTTPAAEAARRARRPPATVDDILDAVGDVPADGPTSINAILTALNLSKTPAATATVKDTLERLGATVTERNRSGGPSHGLAANSRAGTGAGAQPAGAPAERNPRELEQHISKLSERAVGWSAKEYAYQLCKHHQIEASETEIAEILARISNDGAMSRPNEQRTRRTVPGPRRATTEELMPNQIVINAQPLQALTVANERRCAKAQLKAGLRRGDLTLAHVLADPPVELRSTLTFEVLLCARFFGREKLRALNVRALRNGHVNLAAPLGELTERQRAWLARELRR